MSGPRVRSRAAARPFRWIGKGIGRGAKGVWRMVRHGRRELSLPMASLTATLVDSRLATTSDISSEWCDRPDEAFLQLPDLPQLQLPSWLTTTINSWRSTANDSSRSSSSTNRDTSSNSVDGTVYSSRTTRPLAVPTLSSVGCGISSNNSNSSSDLSPTCTAANGLGCCQFISDVTDNSSVQMLGQMLSTDNSFPMVLQPIGDSSSTAMLSSSGDDHQPQHDSTEHDTNDLHSSSSGQYSSGRQQHLLTVGTRHWGNWWDGRGLLKVKIYDFALYVDGQQVSANLPALGSCASGSGVITSGQHHKQQQQQQQPQPDLPAQIKSHNSGVGMSLILKASREVPLYLLQEEYEKVLERRLARAGGDSADSSALKQLLSGLGDPQRLPAAVCRGPGNSSVAKGAMIVFERTAHGSVTARIGPHVLDVVHSPKLSEALFDLYLGDKPVSKAAKEAAAEVLQRMAKQQQHQQLQYYLPKNNKEVMRCEGVHAGDINGHGLQLSVSDLAACVLHVNN